MEILSTSLFRVTAHTCPRWKRKLEYHEDLRKCVCRQNASRRLPTRLRVQIASNMYRELRQYLVEGLEVRRLGYEIPSSWGRRIVRDRDDGASAGVEIAPWQTGKGRWPLRSEGRIFSQSSGRTTCWSSS